MATYQLNKSGAQIEKALDDATKVVANPSTAATTDLTKLTVGNTTYNISGGGSSGNVEIYHFCSDGMRQWIEDDNGGEINGITFINRLKSLKTDNKEDVINTTIYIESEELFYRFYPDVDSNGTKYGLSILEYESRNKSTIRCKFYRLEHSLTLFFNLVDSEDTQIVESIIPIVSSPDPLFEIFYLEKNQTTNYYEVFLATNQHTGEILPIKVLDIHSKIMDNLFSYDYRFKIGYYNENSNKVEWFLYDPILSVQDNSDPRYMLTSYNSDDKMSLVIGIDSESGDYIISDLHVTSRFN